MTTRNRILSLALSLLMVVALFAPIATVFAAENLQIVAASDNGGTTATGTAKEAIAGLGSGTSWYSANRTNLSGKISIATYTLHQTAFVDGVKVAFYFADQRSFEFSIEYSLNGEDWDTALERTWSTQQTVDRTAETFEFAEAVEALYLRIKIYDARVLATGAQNNYGAFYTFEAFGEYDPDGAKAPAVDDALVAILAKADQFKAEDYTVDSWSPLAALLPGARDLVGKDYTYQAAIDEAVANLNAALKALYPLGQVLAIQAYQSEGAQHTNAIYRAPAACPNLRAQDGVWYSANAAGTATTAAIFVLPIESELYEIQLDWCNGAQRGYEYALYTSLDNESWTEIVAPGTISTGETTTTIDLTAVDDYEGTAVYVKLVSADGYCRNADGSVSNNGWIALSEIRFYGDKLTEGVLPPADFEKADNWVNIQLDLTEDLYTADSWKAFDDAINAVDYELGLADQDKIDAAVAAIAEAYANLKFNNVSEIQIAQSYWSDLAGGTAWTNGAVIFTEPGYTLDQYKVNNMTIQNWTRIFAEPTEEAGIFAISAIVESGTNPAATEMVPENDFGTGFVIALNHNGNNVEAAGSQYASDEFGNRNEAARVAMNLQVGDLVQLNNVLFSAEDFEAEGEDMQAAWLETEGTWKHRYWNTVGLGEFTPTVINRKSGQTNDDGQYIARDEFEGFVSYSTLTKLAQPASIVYATDNGGTSATSTILEAVGLGSGTSWYSAHRNTLADKTSIATLYLNQASYVDGIEIAFYKANERSYEFSVEYSMNNEDWEVALDKTWSTQLAEDMLTEEFYFDDTVEALYVRVKIYDAKVIATGASNNYGAFYSVNVIGETNPAGAVPELPAADYAALETWKLIQMDLTASLYTPDSWKAFDDAIKAVKEGYNIAESNLLAAEIQLVKDAYAALTFVDLEGIQISHSYFSDMAVAPAWTNATVMFTEPGFSLDQYKVNDMTLANWTRIFAAPTATAGVYEITLVLAPGTAVTADELVPENDYGTGFVLAMNLNDDTPDEVPYGSQYASQEFGNRNAAAFEAMNLAVGDLVQLNNVLFSAEDFEAEGEEMQAAWLETTGSWKHRYWNTVGLGEFNPTVINRPSNKTNDNGEFLARDEFDGFTTASTLTKYEAPAYKLGDLDEDGEVGLSDLTLMSQTLAGWDSDINRLAADLDGDGEIGLSDLTVISQLLAGWDVELG